MRHDPDQKKCPFSSNVISLFCHNQSINKKDKFYDINKDLSIREDGISESK